MTYLFILFKQNARADDIRLEPLCERTSGVINKLVLLLRVFTVFLTRLRRLEIFRRKNLLRTL